MDSVESSHPIIHQTSKLNLALSKAQGEFKQPELNRTAKVFKNGSLLYETHYADLNEIIEAIRPALTNHELCFTQTIQHLGPGWALVLTLRHSSGEIVESFLPLNMNLPDQQLGGQLTYLKRYQLGAFFGLAAEFDDDQNADPKAKGDSVEFSDKKKNQGGAKTNQNTGSQQNPAPKAQNKPPASSNPPNGRNEAPASQELLSQLYELQNARGVSDNLMNQLLVMGYGRQAGAPVPTWIVEATISHLKDKNSGPASIESLTVQMEINRKNSGPQTTAKKENDPGEFIMPVGEKDVKGHRLASLSEATLKKIKAHAEKELTKHPNETNVSMWFDIKTNVVAFLKSVGAE